MTTQAPRSTGPPLSLLGHYGQLHGYPPARKKRPWKPPQAWLPSPLPLQDLSPARLGTPLGPGRDEYTTCSLRVLWGTAAGCQEGWTQNEGSDGPRRRGGEQPVGIPSSSACSEEPLPVTPQEK